MPDIKVITERELRHLVQLDLAAIECIEHAFAVLAGGMVVMPPILSMAIEDYNGEVDVKAAYVPGVDSFAVKMSPGFFDNPKIGLPSTSGLMVLFSSKTGVLEAMLLDNGYLTDIRTAAAGAVAARHLSRKNSTRACIVGTGMQAQLQLKALTLVREIKQAVIWGRDKTKADKIAIGLSAELGIPVTAQENLEDSVKSADIVVTTTPATSPLINSEWLQRGQHVTAMGSDQSHKNEIDAKCIMLADHYVADRLSQTSQFGELRSAIEQGFVADGTIFAELGDIVCDKSKGRKSDDEITICDLTGTGVQDTAIATFARLKAEEQHLGTIFKN